MAVFKAVKNRNAIRIDDASENTHCACLNDAQFATCQDSFCAYSVAIKVSSSFINDDEYACKYFEDEMCQNPEVQWLVLRDEFKKQLWQRWIDWLRGLPIIQIVFKKKED